MLQETATTCTLLFRGGGILGVARGEHGLYETVQNDRQRGAEQRRSNNPSKVRAVQCESSGQQVQEPDDGAQHVDTEIVNLTIAHTATASMTYIKPETNSPGVTNVLQSSYPGFLSKHMKRRI